MREGLIKAVRPIQKFKIQVNFQEGNHGIHLNYKMGHLVEIKL